MVDTVPIFKVYISSTIKIPGEKMIGIVIYKFRIGHDTILVNSRMNFLIWKEKYCPMF